MTGDPYKMGMLHRDSVITEQVLGELILRCVLKCVQECGKANRLIIVRDGRGRRDQMN